MLPLWLYLENFGSFRSATTIDLTDAEYFVLVGPTGAGKSTVIDAICFALYGTVPRWGRENVVSLALPPSASLGRVALVFEAGGRRYGAVRVLMRDRKGRVSTREARLDELDLTVPVDAGVAGLLDGSAESLAEGEGVTAAVQQIIGLPYKYFVRSVVVPQGRFADFLHAPPGERQDLLVRLLDAGAYERVRQLAVREEEVAKREVAFAKEQLAALTDTDEATERVAAAQMDALDRLAAGIRSTLEDMLRYDEELRAARAELAIAQEHVTALAALAVPEGVTQLAERLRDARENAARLAADVAERETEDAAAAAELAGAGDPADLERIRDGHTEHARLVAEVAKSENRLVETSEEVGAFADLLERADTEHAAAAVELDRARAANTAADLATRLVAGQPCPVCLRLVDEPVRHAATADLEEIEWLMLERERAVAKLERQHREAEVRFGKLEQTVKDLRARIEALGQVLAEAPDKAAVEQQLKLLETARERATGARTAVVVARQAHSAAVGQVAALQGRAEQAWRELDGVRDTVAALRPPVLVRDDPAAAWRALLTWREETAARQREEVAAVADGVRWTEEALGELRASVVSRLSAEGLAVADDAPPISIGAVVTEAVTAARGRLGRVQENRRRAAQLTEQVARREQQARVAHELAMLLRANNFEKWLCAEALGLLVDAASDILRELSGGQYELALSENDDIEVVDYGEAGLRRSARTLSGGETFQTGLALALALSEQVAALAAAAARSLDAIFLDEGFGALDAAALDTVAATLERLSASGDRTVGIVTHVPALAERVPVRFEVTRDAGGSHIRRLAP